LRASRERACSFARADRSSLYLEEGRDNHESVYALFEKQLARRDAKLEAEEKEKADLEATLEKERADLEATLEKEKADLDAKVFELEWRQCKDCIEHELDYKDMYDLYTTRS
jgi:hypothetical protein